MVLSWQHERVYGCNIIFKTYNSNNIEVIHIQKYHVIYFLYFVYGIWMWVGPSADLVTLEEEYPAWVAFSNLLIPIPCIIIRKLCLRS